jgi:hypothetical protein
MNFQAFIDESISADEFVLAGHIGTPENLATFAREWESLLPKFGTLAENGKYHFKMSEMAESDERMKRVPVFYKLIEDNVISSVSYRINLIDFARAQERVHAIASRFNWNIHFGLWASPHFFAFRGLLDKFHEEREKFQSKLPLDQKIDFIFDDRTEKGPILKAWDEHLEVKEEHVRAYYGATPRFENDQQVLPLQAADLWAWWVREWYEEDAAPVPHRLLNFDFRTWRGKRRPNIVISLNEDQIVDVLQSIAFASAAEGNLTPILGF